MMREILFRGIPKNDVERHFFADIWKDNCEGSFVYGSLIISKDRYYICVLALCKINSCINNGMTSMIEVIPETVGQYTELCDENGKKIFEGDIVDILTENEEIGIVTYDDGGFLVEADGFCVDFHSNIYGTDLEIIGNIHDNPELMRGDAGDA